jgi:hypothetical protein
MRLVYKVYFCRNRIQVWWWAGGGVQMLRKYGGGANVLFAGKLGMIVRSKSRVGVILAVKKIPCSKLTEYQSTVITTL